MFKSLIMKWLISTLLPKVGTAILGVIQAVAAESTTGDEKREAVKKKARELGETTKDSALNLAVELGVTYLKREGKL